MPGMAILEYKFQIIVMAQDARAGDGVFVGVSRQSGKCGFNFVVTASCGGLERVMSLFRSHVSPLLYPQHPERHAASDDKQYPVEVAITKLSASISELPS